MIKTHHSNTKNFHILLVFSFLYFSNRISVSVFCLSNNPFKSVERTFQVVKMSWNKKSEKVKKSRHCNLFHIWSQKGVWYGERGCHLDPPTPILRLEHSKLNTILQNIRKCSPKNANTNRFLLNYVISLSWQMYFDIFMFVNFPCSINFSKFFVVEIFFFFFEPNSNV